jgi:putative perosamine synthetase
MPKYKIYTSYARTAIYLVLLSIGAKGKKVLLPAFTCATTLPDAIVQAGGIPVFVDIDVHSLEMIQDDIKNKISSDTVAIISRHYYGASYMDYVVKIQDIAKKYNLIHIEDKAHCYGLKKDLIGDVAIYSFSKNMISPGGGLLVTRNYDIWQNCLDIQDILNTEAFNYMQAIKNDRSCDIDRRYEPINLVKRVVCKVLKFFAVLQTEFFYKINSNDIGKKFDVFDTRMTTEQFKHILVSIRDLKRDIKHRKSMVLSLNQFLPSFLNVNNNIFINYVVYADDYKKLEKIFNSFNIKIRRVWPYFQDYWGEQMTKNVKQLSQKLLLIGLDCLDKEKIQEMENMLNES